MSILFFIHGTGVRKQGYEQTLQNIKSGLQKVDRTDLTVLGIPWGDLLGTKVTEAAIAAMLPATAAKGDAKTDSEVEACLWAELLDDPLFELRLAALKAPNKPTIATPGMGLASDALKRRLRSLNLTQDASLGGLTEQDIRSAASWLADGDGSSVLTAAANAIGDPNDPALVMTTARAIVACALARSRGDIGAGPDALYLLDQRNAVVEAVRFSLSEGSKGAIGDWLKKQATQFAEARATSYGKSRRSGLMTTVSPGVGDILKYQRRGDEVLALLRTELAKLSEEKVYVIGHSLGGIFLVDLLSAANPAANVKGLITVGSQSPFFLACDAMGALRSAAPKLSPFTPWLNIYDRNDFLSFCAARTFSGVQGIEDFEVSSGVSFPDSHGAYWRMSEVYRKISAFCT